MIGTISGDPYLKDLPGGGKVWSCVFATDGASKRVDGEFKPDSMFIEIKCFNKRDRRQLADWCDRNLRRGMLICLTGRLVQERWNGPEGDKRMKHLIEIEEIWQQAPEAAA